MNNIHLHPHYASIRQPHPAVAANLSVLSARDRQSLVRHLRACDVTREPFLAHVLRHKLETSTIVDAGPPHDAVAGGSTVSYRIDDGPQQSGLLSHRARTMGIGGVIPVLSLLGATLIGMRVGAYAPLLREDGSIAAVTVLDVEHPA